MAIGDVLPPEGRTFTDPETGVTVRQLTQYLSHSHHVYFTNSGWHDGGRRLLIGSMRTGEKNLFSVDVGGDGSITQLTDFPRGTFDEKHSFLRTAVNPHREEAYAWVGTDLVAIDLTTREQRRLFSAPAGYRVTIPNVTADGKYVCSSLVEDLTGKFDIDLMHGYVGFATYHDAKPHSQLIRVPTDGSGPMDVVHEEKYWINHVNTSPTLPNILSFCHEGPWNRVDNRIWCLDHATGKVWQVRPRKSEGERVGHEYWMADGERLGYHGHGPEGSFYGAVKYDDSGLVEAPFPSDSTHFHSNDLDLIVGDGKRDYPWLLVWTREDDKFSPARRLLFHRGSWHIQELHVHPRLTPDGRRVVYTADPQGYGNVYIAEIPEALDSLPLAETEKPKG